MKYFLSLIILLSFGRCYAKSILWRVVGQTTAPWYGSGPAHYPSLVSLLNSDGFTVDTIYNLTSKNLLSCDVIVINSLSIGGSLISEEEVDSLESYQQSKDGCVLLTGDANFWDDSFMKPENRVFALNAFNCISKNGGIIIMTDYTELLKPFVLPAVRAFHMDLIRVGSIPALWFDSLDYSYCFFDGIDSLFFQASGELSATSPAKVIGWAPTGKPLIACFNCDHCLGVNERTNSTQKLLRATPNPFYHSVKIEGASGNIRVYDLSGKLVTEANSIWDGKDLNSNKVSPGVYFLRAKDCRALKVIKLGN